MKVVLTTGYEHSGYRLVHGILRDAGLVEAQPSRRERISAADLQVKLLKAYAQSGEKRATNSPGRLWEELAVDLFLAHMETPAWGWADHNTVGLLDFWRRFDKQTRFVLVYSSPEFAIGQALRGHDVTSEAVSTVVQAWSAQTRTVLRFYRRFQGRCELVNTVGALQAPAHLVERISERWAMSLQLATNYVPQREGVSTVAASLARGAVRGHDDALSLYATLESCAGVAGERAEPAEELQAWNDYCAERRAFAAAQVSVKELEQKLALSSEQAAAAALDQQRQQVASVTKARDELQGQVKALEQQVQRLTDGRDTQGELAAERLAQIETLKSQLAPQPVTTTDPSLETKFKESAQENELLLLQLHQVQEELEHYYLQNQELLKKSRVNRYLYRFLRDNQPSEVVIDLRGEIDGENWYHAEEDGRWAGPKRRSLLSMPALLPGMYALAIEVVDAMTPEILAKMTVSVNGRNVQTQATPLDRYPTLVTGILDTQGLEEESWDVSLEFPDLTSPLLRGEEDTRQLAVRVKSLAFRLEGQSSSSFPLHVYGPAATE